jgi:hypothetical protein
MAEFTGKTLPSNISCSSFPKGFFWIPSLSHCEEGIQQSTNHLELGQHPKLSMTLEEKKSIILIYDRAWWKNLIYYFNTCLYRYGKATSNGSWIGCMLGIQDLSKQGIQARGIAFHIGSFLHWHKLDGLTRDASTKTIIL